MKSILIVDDEVTLVRNLADFVGGIEGGYNVATATRGDEALKMIEERPYDILLTDVRMPGLDGLELISQALAIRPDLRPVVMTAHGTSHMQRDALDRGALRFLTKPVDLDVLEVLLDQLNTEVADRSQPIGGLTALEIVEYLMASRESKVLEFTASHGTGRLVVVNGTLIHCAAGDLEGDNALMTMATWGEGTVQELHRESPEVYERNITLPADEILTVIGRNLEDSAGPPDQPIHAVTLEQETGVENPDHEPHNTGDGKENTMPESRKTRSQQLQERLNQLVVSSAEIGGALAVGNDGLILAANLPEAFGKAERVGAQTAALLGLNQRTLQQLGCGESEVLISQGKEAWMVAVAAGKVGIVALAQAGSNLGMIMLDLRDAAEDVKQILS